MRCWFVFTLTVWIGLFPLLMKSQEVSPSAANKARLPEESLRSSYRILVGRYDTGFVEAACKVAKHIGEKFKRNVYITRQGAMLELHAGDYTESRWARQSLGCFKKTYRKAKVVKAQNEMVVIFVPFKRNSKEAEIRQATKEGFISDRIQPERPEWDDPRYLAANTAKNEDYLSEDEKLVFYYLNLARMNPQLFAATYLEGISGSNNEYERSLIAELKQMKPAGLLKPDRKLFETASCHAVESGERGYTGHGRYKCEALFLAECCCYGPSDPLRIVILLLVDKNVPSLGHRKICLSGNYNTLGVSIRPHSTYNMNTVLDFGLADFEIEQSTLYKIK